MLSVFLVPANDGNTQGQSEPSSQTDKEIEDVHVANDPQIDGEIQSRDASHASISDGTRDEAENDLENVPPNDTANQNANEGQDRCRKRIRNEGNWVRNRTKSKRNRGEQYEYKTKKNERKVKPPKQMGAGCGIPCRKQCKQNITYEQRELLFKKYWQMGDVERQREYLLRHITKSSPVRKSGTKRPRKTTLSYFFYIRGTKVEVCQVFFLQTLGISTRTISTVLSKNDSNGNLDSDRRGKHRNQRKIPDEIRRQVREHIEMFPRVEGHYVRKDSKREYLESSLTLAEMYRQYEKWCDEKGYTAAKFWFYEHVFGTEFNISFHCAKKDQCTLCTEFENADQENKEELAEKQEQHLASKQMAREEKERDKQIAEQEATSSAIVVDLQAVLGCPHGETSILFYKRKLSIYNFTVFDLATKEGTCYMWDQSTGGRGANDMASCLYMYIADKASQGCKDLTVWSDGCAAQNKNRFLFTAYLYALQNTGLNSIEHKYLETGHSQNEGDNMHSVIERSMKGTSLYVPSQFYNQVKKSKKTGTPYEVVQMRQRDFFDFKELALCDALNLNWSQKDNNDEKVKWSKVMVVKAIERLPYTLLFKYAHNEEEYRTVSIQKKRRGRQVNFKNVQLRNAYGGPLPIPSAKLKDLLQLKKIIPNEHHHFYDSLKGDNSAMNEADDDVESD